MLAERGWEVTGYDLSDVAIGEATAGAQKCGLKLNAVVADGGAFGYGINRYDLVAAIYANGFVLVAQGLPTQPCAREADHRRDGRNAA